MLFVPGDAFANRHPDPVLQQIDDFEDGTVWASDCFRTVGRYSNRIVHLEQFLTACPAMRVMTDPSTCDTVTLAFCPDVQADAHD